MCGRLMPRIVAPSADSVFAWLQSRPPPAPALYWITVSIAGHLFRSTSCWWRAERSDSPPGGNACQYIRLRSGHGGLCADVEATKPRVQAMAAATVRSMAGDLLARTLAMALVPDIGTIAQRVDPGPARSACRSRGGRSGTTVGPHPPTGADDMSADKDRAIRRAK